MARILIVDDDPIFSEPLAFYIQDIGHECEVAQTRSGGMARAAGNEFDIIFLDILLPDGSGMELIGTLKAMPYSPEIIIITGKTDLADVEQALVEGALDYLEKPLSYQKLRLLLERALQHRIQKRDFSESRTFRREGIIGNDPGLRQCLEVIARAALTDASVLITGETGTGKELMARAVHLNSRRAKHDLVTVDCTNLPPTLAETLLFGHVKGTFTGAVNDREGLIRQAVGGTLYLDEVGDLHPTVQKSLLGVLQKKTYRPLGARNTRASDFRVVSSTNRDLSRMVEQNRFRRDLYYRLAGFHVSVPPVRERMGDIEALVTHYVSRICEDFGMPRKGVSREFLSQLPEYDWPGNIRELVNVLHTSIANAMSAPVLFPLHLPVEIRVHLRKKSLKDAADKTPARPTVEVAFNPDRLPEFTEFKRITTGFYLDRLIGLAEGDPALACRISGVSRSGLYHLLNKHGKKLKAP